MAQSAMNAAIWDGEWALNSHNLDDWLLCKDELKENEVNDPLLKLTKHEIAQQLLNDIEDLGRSYKDDWLDDFALFEELQTLTPVDEVNREQKAGSHGGKIEEEQTSTNDGSIIPEFQKKLFVDQDLFSVSYENAATFILSDGNILYINSQPYVSLTPLQPEEGQAVVGEEEKLSPKESDGKNPGGASVQREPVWVELNAGDAKTEMAVVDEILRNTAMELDQWESDTSRSEISLDGTSASDMSPKEAEEEEEEAAEETDDPDWKPDTLKISGRICVKRSKPYRRCGSLEEKTLRKKEQNRHAATRYRQKKKAEANEILKDEEILKKRKIELEEKVIDIQREIKCLKQLMRDLFKAKGIIN